jgi:hypothetical protein
MISSRQRDIPREILGGIWNWYETSSTLIGRLFPGPSDGMGAFIFGVFILSALHKFRIDFVLACVFNIPLYTHIDNRPCTKFESVGC